MTQNNKTVIGITEKEFDELTNSVGAALTNLTQTYETDGTLGFVVVLRHETKEGEVSVGMASNGAEDNVIDLLEQTAVKLRNATPENSTKKEHEILLPH